MQERDNRQNSENRSANVDLAAGQSIAVPVIAEQLVIEKKTVETAKVVISKKVLEEESTVDEILSSEEITVERREINQYVDEAPEPVRQVGDVTIISVVKEVLVVQKRLMLVEELHVTKLRKQTHFEQTETLRKEEITVTKTVSGTDLTNNESNNQ